MRRPTGPWTPTVQALLGHIRDPGFDLAPEPFGYDDLGREMVGYIPGTTVGWSLPWPEMIREEGLLAQVGQAISRYHRAVADFRPAGLVPWQSGTAALQPSELVCHHDLRPTTSSWPMDVSSGSSIGILPGPGAPCPTWPSWPGSGFLSTGLW